MAVKVDLSGKRFGRLTVIEKAKSKTSPSGAKRAMWKCKCDCGNETVVWSYSLIKGRTQSCGCLHLESFADVTRKYKVTHGGSKERLYRVWRDILSRCNNPNDIEFHNYGGRGITICSQWEDYAVFREWAINSGYDSDAEYGEKTIDRIDVNKNYSPDNCRWVDIQAQNNNQRRNRRITYNGETMTMAQWAKRIGISSSGLMHRLNNGWPLDEALTRKSQKRSPRHDS